MEARHWDSAQLSSASAVERARGTGGGAPAAEVSPSAGCHPRRPRTSASCRVGPVESFSAIPPASRCLASVRYAPASSAPGAVPRPSAPGPHASSDAAGGCGGRDEEARQGSTLSPRLAAVPSTAQPAGSAARTRLSARGEGPPPPPAPAPPAEGSRRRERRVAVNGSRKVSHIGNAGKVTRSQKGSGSLGAAPSPSPGGQCSSAAAAPPEEGAGRVAVPALCRLCAGSVLGGCRPGPRATPRGVACPLRAAGVLACGWRRELEAAAELLSPPPPVTVWGASVLRAGETSWGPARWALACKHS